MDYDRTAIAPVYDRTRDLTDDLMAVWLDRVTRDAAPAPGAVIIDLGCGTGRFSRPLAERFQARVIAIDPSQTMLDAARAKGAGAAIEYHLAPAEALPLPDASADCVFISMAFHHFSKPQQAARECRRVLRPHGRVCLRNITRETDFPHRHFFPSVEADLPARGAIDSVFAAAGFARLVHETLTQPVAPDWAAYEGKIALRAYSTLARLPDAEFAAGLARLRAFVASDAPPGPVTEEVDWLVFGPAA